MEIRKDNRGDDNSRTLQGEQRKTTRLPVFGQPFDSSFNSYEQEIVNFLPETTKNASNDSKKLYAGFRPGYFLDLFADYITNETRGRGIWSYNQTVIFVIDNKVYMNFEELITLNSIGVTTRCGGMEISDGNFFLCDGLDGYIIYPNGGYKMVEESYLRWSANTYVEYGDKRIPTAYDAATATTYVYTADTYQPITTVPVTFPSPTFYPTFNDDGVRENDIVTFQVLSGTLPTGITAGTTYRVMGPGPASGGLYSIYNLKTLAGAPVTITGTGSGTFTMTYKRQTKRGTVPTGSSEPTWPTTIAHSVVDGDIIWTCKYQQNSMARKWKSNHPYVVGDLVQPTTETSLYYEVIASDGLGGTTEPTWPLAVGESVTLDGVTYECIGYYGGFPSPHIPTPVFMDGYVILAEEESVDFYSSGVSSVFSWSPLDFASAENFPDKIVALARQANFIIAFGTNSTELFYNAANEEGSPFSRNENYLLQVGLANMDSIFATEKYTMWIAKNPAGGHSVWSLNGYEAREVSTETMERWLDSNYNTVRGFALRSKGHILFVLTDFNYTFAYDLEEELWIRWTVGESEDGFPIWTTSPYPLGYGTDAVIGQDLYGNMMTIQPDMTTDTIVTWDEDLEAFISETEPIIGRIKWAKQDFGTMRRKFYHKAELVGQFSPSRIMINFNPITLKYYDHDNVNPSGVVDEDYVNEDPHSLSLRSHSIVDRLYTTQLGSSRRRSWEIVFPAGFSDANSKLEALEIVYSIGRH